jgi:hypothetical protein
VLLMVGVSPNSQRAEKKKKKKCTQKRRDHVANPSQPHKIKTVDVSAAGAVST